MNVSSVKNLNGVTFSAVQDATLTDVVQSNSAQWGGNEIVYHDSTLSGNGTSASPLGLNETVLWSNTTTGVYSATLSEPYSGFERVRVKFACDENLDKAVYNEFPGHCTQLNLIGQATWGGMGILFCCGDLSASNNFTTLIPTLNRSIFIHSNTAAPSFGTKRLPLFEIVGINRLSANS